MKQQEANSADQMLCSGRAGRPQCIGRVRPDCGEKTVRPRGWGKMPLTGDREQQGRAELDLKQTPVEH